LAAEAMSDLITISQKDLQELQAFADLFNKKLQTTMSKLESQNKPSPALKRKSEIKAQVAARVQRRVNKRANK
jgi:hypothetical protein